jgi:hypothetical protein
MEEEAGTFSGSTALPAHPKNLKLTEHYFFDVFYES